MQNLTLAFPEKNESDKRAIAKKFYLNFTDTFIETIKLVSASDQFLKTHFSGNTEMLEELYQKGKKVQVHLAHNFNWELANITMPLYMSYQMMAVYMPIKNKAVDRLFLKIRSKTGCIMLPATTISRAIIPYRNQQYLLALLADQNPGVPSKSFWLNFFGKPTPFVKGPEKSARANDAAVVFAQIMKPKRGYYKAHFTLATETPLNLPEKELTSIYIKYLEKIIREYPEMWLWSHRRWKHEWKPEYGPLIQ